MEISIITDHPVIPINFLVHQATFAVKAGLDRETALRSITINPAKVLGLDDRIGSLEVGKLGDLVVWSGDPLDVMQRALRVFIEGEEVYTWERTTARRSPPCSVGASSLSRASSTSADATKSSASPASTGWSASGR